MSTTKWREGLQFDLDLTLDFVKYRFEWSDWLAEVGGDTLSSAPITVDAGLVFTGLTVVGSYVEAIFNCDTGAAPTVGDILKVTCQAITAGGQKKARSINFEVVQRQ